MLDFEREETALIPPDPEIVIVVKSPVEAGILPRKKLHRHNSPARIALLGKQLGDGQIMRLKRVSLHSYTVIPGYKACKHRAMRWDRHRHRDDALVEYYTLGGELI